MAWAYDAIILPMLCYGSVVFGHSYIPMHIKNSLTRLQRQSMICLCPLRNSTPTGALQIILARRPLDLQIKLEGLMGYTRVRNVVGTSWPGHSKKTLKEGHIKVWSRLASEARIGTAQDETIPLELNWHQPFDIGKETGWPLNDDSAKVFIALCDRNRGRVGGHVDIYLGKAIKPEIQKSMSFECLTALQATLHCLGEVVNIIQSRPNRIIGSLDIYILVLIGPRTGPQKSARPWHFWKSPVCPKTGGKSPKVHGHLSYLFWSYINKDFCMHVFHIS